MTNSLGPCPVSAAIICRFRASRSRGQVVYREEKVIEGKEAWEKAETMEFDKAAFVDILRKLIGENR